MNEKLLRTQAKSCRLTPTAVKEVPNAPVSDIDFFIGKETKAKSRSTINGLATSEGIANNGEAVKVLIPAPDETDLSIFILN